VDRSVWIAGRNWFGIIL